MPSTPPPPTRRAHTPPTPLHGPTTNSYEPYSPRRSNRIHNRDAKYSSSSPPAAASQRQQDNSHTPTNARLKQKQTLHRTNSQTYSPPSSPIQSPPQTRRRYISSPRSQFRNQSSMDRVSSMAAAEVDSDDMAMPDAAEPWRLGAGQSDFKSRLGLPTPSKTPKKRSAPSETNIASAARILFPNRLASDDDIMPSPRKARKSKKHNAFSLESFAAESEDQNVPAIEIYTDSKERIPEVDESEENPFLVRRSARRSTINGNGVMEAAAATTARPKKQEKTKYGMTKQIDEMVDNNEGMVYVFRGKKIFRRFDDNNDEGDKQEGESLSDQELRRRVGAEARRPFTRSAVKPRLLFPPKDHATDEEEAVTDIEGDAPIQPSQPIQDATVTTPVKKHFRPATPPTTGRRPRKNTDVDPTPNGSPSAGPSNLDGAGEREHNVRRSAGPFDSWQRTKPGSFSSSTSVAPAKRHATEQLGREEAAGVAAGTSKRTRGNGQ